MNRITKIGSSTAALMLCMALIACDSGPSESDMKAAITALPELAMLGIEIQNVEKHDCTDAGQGRYRCTYKVTARNKVLGTVGSSDESFLFEKRGST